MNDRADAEELDFARVAMAIVVAVVLVALLAMWRSSTSNRAIDPVIDAVNTESFGATGQRFSPRDVYNPVAEGEPTPTGFRQILPRDVIAPIYDPTFVAAETIGWPDDTDVIAVTFGDEARAYPVSHLSGRELVIDDIDGIPILVSW